MSEFTVYPAIDLRQGKVVRLVQGDPARQTVFSDDPAAVALRWAAAGATWLHVVNLDGAFEQPDEQNQVALRSILQALQEAQAPTQVQLGGGLRTLADLERAASLGVARMVLGTAVIAAPEMLTAALERYGSSRIAAALDVANGRLRLRGWLEESQLDPVALASRLVSIGVRTLIYTDVTRDGTGAGLNLAPAQSLARASGASVVVSGGVRSLDDVRRVRLAGLSGVILGRALYQGDIDLAEALAC